MVSCLVVLLILKYVQCTRIGVTSCSSQRDGKGALWADVLQANPDYLILLGDNIYADKKTPLGFVEATPYGINEEYLRLSEDPNWRALVERVGWRNIFATWDDHDYGINDGDKTYKYRNESMKSFLDFFRFPESDKGRMMNRGGVYSAHNIVVSPSRNLSLNIKVILLDTRYFKDSEGIAGGDFLGEEQWAWLEEELQDTSADVVLLGSSIQVLPSQKIVEESWSTFPLSRARLLRLISDAASPNVLLLSGDVHMAEISQAVCFSSDASSFRHLWEFSSSGMSHTFTTFMSTPMSMAEQGSEKDVRSRGWLMNTLFNLYQATYPAKYRENRFKDQYKGLHFVTIDVDGVPVTEGVESPLLGVLTMRVVNYFGDVVMEKILPILPSKQTIKGRAEEGLTESWVSAVVKVAADAPTTTLHNCVPRWGQETTLQRAVFLFSLAIFLFVIIALPVMGMLWLVFASIYYITIEKELRRRENIEAMHSKRLKSKGD